MPVASRGLKLGWLRHRFCDERIDRYPFLNSLVENFNPEHWVWRADKIAWALYEELVNCLLHEDKFNIRI